MNDWMKLLWNPKQAAPMSKEEKLEDSATENVISEPVRSIVGLIIKDRRRFIIEESLRSYPMTSYQVLDLYTDELFVAYEHFSVCRPSYAGPSWAKDKEIEWAINTIKEHFENVNKRLLRINDIRERNRLIEIYA